MSLLENNKTVQQGVALLDQTNKTTYLTDLYNSNYGTVTAAVAFVFLGFIIAPLQYAYQNLSGTKTYDQLCAKFAKLSIQVEESKGGAGYNALLKQQREVTTELRGRVQNLTASLTGKTAKADANAVIQAAQYKLQQAYCAAKGMPTDGTNDDQDVIDAANQFSDELVAGLSAKSIRSSASEVGSTVDGISSRMEARVKELAERGYCGGNTDDVQEQLEETVGDQVRQKFTGRGGDRKFAALTAELRPTQVNKAAEKEVSKCIADLKKLAKARQDAIEAVGKNTKAVEKVKEKAEEIVAELGEESRSEEPTGLYADRAQLEAELEEASQKDDEESNVDEIQGELDEVNASIAKLEKSLLAEIEKAKGLERTGRTLARNLQKAEAKYFEHLEKFFGFTFAESDVQAPRGMDRKVIDALVNAGRVENEEEQDNGSVKVTYVKLPKDADLKKAVDREALKEKVVADREKDVDLVTRLRQEAIARKQPKAKEAELTLDERIARGIAMGLRGIGILPSDQRSVDDEEDRGSQVDDQEFVPMSQLRRPFVQRHSVDDERSQFPMGQRRRTDAPSMFSDQQYSGFRPTFVPPSDQRRVDEVPLSSTLHPSSRPQRTVEEMARDLQDDTEQ